MFRFLAILTIFASLAIAASAAKSADIPVNADYDGDGVVDSAYWRPDTGVWYVSNAANAGDVNKITTFKWGQPGDIPVQADYDGDKRADFAVFRPAENGWYIFYSHTNDWRIYTFGNSVSDMLVPADYTGDGKADIAVYGNGKWAVMDSETGETDTMEFGFSDDVAVPGDYDNDGIIDFAVLRKDIYYIYETARPIFRTATFADKTKLPAHMVEVKAAH